ncbi:Gfo/Idh/MocA family protein [Roseibacillus ishigakijimensis]|uniref:Gfo/Idh/MocA family oxidoreductase n=1 Tax=Roseibacillus ishigakijimensis TaxID=454146 RepID=A0A934RQC9_9BACT|nr:Gfo/Idh/MocA family oxidoreductase [Roseibacillus ishigakijimensis]MBK1832596.1 Gfo/Idh/MocA family oxidoreductase [Roseibacillus ishigakijimensis]
MKTIGIIMNGVTGRMGTNQHLVRSILAIREQGGVRCGEETIMPDPILTGRNLAKVKALAEKYGVERYTDDLDAALADDYNEIFFDASGTPYRVAFLEKAIAAGKHVYCEKPTATEYAEALRIAEVAEAAGVKNGTVQDKLWLPGLVAFQKLKEEGFFGEILSVRGEFGYWVFTGHDDNRPPQRPSWNYRKEDGGGMIIDMHCHWQYVIANLFGEITSVMTHAATHIPERVNEEGQPYPCTADDSAYAMFKTDTGVFCQFNSSWNVRVRRDDLLVMQVDGTKGSAIVGLRKCWAQSMADTPVPVWNPDIDNPINFYENWEEISPGECDNAFKAQWELFLKHVVCDEPFRWTLREGAKGVQLAELSLQSHAEERWVKVG